MSHTKEPWKDDAFVSRFWSRVDVKSESECWEWTRGTTSDGYGVFHFGNSSIRTHRFSFQQHFGQIREHDCVCHTCDNPKCVNPSHLWVGTRADNNADKEAKQRGVHPDQSNGEGNTNASITTPEVIAIKVMARKGMPQARIAAFIGVSNAAVCMIVQGDRRQDESEQRISACVNACAGIDTLILRAAAACGGFGRDRMVEAITKQRDELLAALEQISSGEADNGSILSGGECQRIAYDAIASAKESQ